MKVARNCVVCHSDDIAIKLGQFAPFISHRVLDYPICKVIYGEIQIFPTLLTNSMRCKSCGFVFSAIRFDNEEMARIYKDYRGKEYTDIRNIFEPGYDALNQDIGNCNLEINTRQMEMQRFLVDFVDPARTKTVLDYGGDKGQHIPHMLNKCTRYVYDISNVAAVGEIIIINELNGLGAIDFIMAANVLEHVSYPINLINDIKKVCGRDTSIFIDVPLEISEDNILSDDQVPTYFHEHINYFTPRSLSILLRQNGFNVLKMEVIPFDFGWTKGKSIYALARPNW